jgi:hypothetical protein
MYRKIARIVFLSSFVIVLGSFFFSRPSQTAEAQAITFSGYGWSSLIGWMQVQGADYGIKATASGTTRINLSGYAWTSTLGWISFEPVSVSVCTPLMLAEQSGTIGCAPYIDMTGSGPYRVRGFARACSVFQSGCSGQLKSDVDRGGWDGYISLNSGNGPWGWTLSADKTKITGYAWGDSVVGWLNIDATCTGCDITVVPNDSFTVAGCAPSPAYIPTFSWSTDPVAQSCTLVSPNGNSRTTVNSASQTNFTPVGSNYVAPATGVGNYVLECTKGGVTAKVGDINVARCAITGDPFGFCPAPNGTVVKVDAAGTNCPSSSFCPAPNGTILKADAAGSNCPPSFCPGQTFTAAQAGGSCMCSDGTTAKTNTSGTNCPTTGSLCPGQTFTAAQAGGSCMCPVPYQKIAKRDVAGISCPKIREI